MDTARWTLKCATRSVPGTLGRLNEDCYLALPGHGIFAVADGLGGHHDGARASHMALQTLFSSLDGPVTAAGIQRALLKAHTQLRTLATGTRVVGTTIVVVWVYRAALHCFHLGDSRAYRFRNYLLERLTSDHVGKEIADAVDRFDAGRSVGRALGMAGPVQIEYGQHRWHSGDQLLLVTDGVTDRLADLHISNVMERLQGNPERLVATLVADSAAAGGRDDKTALLIFEDEAARDGAANGHIRVASTNLHSRRR